jgi:hypothetical protein
MVRVEGGCVTTRKSRVNGVRRVKRVRLHLHTSHTLLNGAIFVRVLGFPLADWCFRGCLTDFFLGFLRVHWALEDSREGGGWDWEPRIMAR